METALVAQAGLPFRSIPAAGVHGVGWRALPGNLLRLARGVLAARRVLREFRPDVLFFTGGYVGLPVALAGWRLPKVVYVPDLEPPLSLQFLARLAEVVALTAEETAARLGGRARRLVTGYPVRPEMRPSPKAEARGRLGLAAERPVLLVYGGSLGARSINQAVWQGLERLLSATQMVHVVGDRDWPLLEQAVADLPAAQRAGYHPKRYLHAPEMALAMSAADLAVARAGASTLGELPLFGLPAVLVPYPHAWRYQKVNAAYLERQGAAVVVPDEALAERLVPTVLDLLADEGRRARMAEAASRLATPGAAEAIAQAILAVAVGERGRRG